VTTPGTLLLCLALGCASHVSRQEGSDVEAQITVSNVSRTWRIVENGNVVGILVEFEERDGPRGFFSVRNPEHQELGLIDEHGRWWRYRPHAEEPEWLGTGTIVEGARKILNLSPTAELLEVGLEGISATGA
jgi:hypothetical protein